VSRDGVCSETQTETKTPISRSIMSKPFKLLFLCTGNSARSIFAESIGRALACGQFEVHSAGSDPKPAPNPIALKVLAEKFRYPIDDLRSKSWEEFRDTKLDFVITLCDSAKETCPVWSGQPILAHWGSPDPADYEGTDEERETFFWKVAQQIRRRTELFFSLPFEKLDALRLDAATKHIGTIETAV
jgi:protein-tyrosine-phosphatase